MNDQVNKMPKGMMGLPIIRHLSRKPRLALAIGVAALVLVLTGFFQVFGFMALSLTTRSLLAWNCATILYILLAIETMISADEGLMRRRAQLYDDGEGIILGVTVLAAILSIVAIVFELATTRQVTGWLRGLHVGLSTLTLLTSWAFIHISFAFHYAHGYYSEGEPDDEDPCLIFPGKAQPNYVDFLYFSFVIGTSGQTADVSFADTETRRIGLIHCVLSYLFNATVLALTINIAASLIS